MPAIKTMTDSRKRAVQGILNKFRKEDLFNVILKAEQSDFLNGRVKEFRASFDWILKPANFVKVLEDNYANRSKPAKTETPNNVYAQLYAEAVASGEDAYEDPFGLDEPLLPGPEIEEAEIE